MIVALQDDKPRQRLLQPGRCCNLGLEIPFLDKDSHSQKFPDLLSPLCDDNDLCTLFRMAVSMRIRISSLFARVVFKRGLLSPVPAMRNLCHPLVKRVSYPSLHVSLSCAANEFSNAMSLLLEDCRCFIPYEQWHCRSAGRPVSQSDTVQPLTPLPRLLRLDSAWRIFAT